MVASLAGVDGAVLMTKRFEILGFGAEISGSLPEVETIRICEDPEGANSRPAPDRRCGDPSSVGIPVLVRSSRVLAVVISQDGNIRFAATKDDAVHCWIRCRRAFWTSELSGKRRKVESPAVLAIMRGHAPSRWAFQRRMAHRVQGHPGGSAEGQRPCSAGGLAVERCLKERVSERGQRAVRSPHQPAGDCKASGVVVMESSMLVPQRDVRCLPRFLTGVPRRRAGA